jgi:hypothetical protein
MASTFTKMQPGALVSYRESDEDGQRFGRFRKYEKPFGRVLIETIPAYGKQARAIYIREGLVTEASEIPGQTPKPVGPRPTPTEAPTVRQAPKKVEPVAKPKPVEAPKPAPKPVEVKPVLSADWRKEAARRAWETIRARKAAAVPAMA